MESTSPAGDIGKVNKGCRVWQRRCQRGDINGKHPWVARCWKISWTLSYWFVCRVQLLPSPMTSGPWATSDPASSVSASMECKYCCVHSFVSYVHHWHIKRLQFMECLLLMVLFWCLVVWCLATPSHPVAWGSTLRSHQTPTWSPPSYPITSGRLDSYSSTAPM